MQQLMMLMMVVPSASWRISPLQSNTQTHKHKHSNQCFHHSITFSSSQFLFPYNDCESAGERASEAAARRS
jgi:hypothetical protein